MKAQSPGDPVRIDHMTVQRDGQALKEFRAVDPVSCVMVRRVFLRATALNAKRFLDAVFADMPFPVRSVQVDGGSEFRSLWTGALTVSAVSDALAKHQRWHNADRPPSALLATNRSVRF